MKPFTLITILFISAHMCAAQGNKSVLDIMLTNYEYPFAVGYLNFKSQGKDVKMAYMDVKPATSNGKTIVLLHGKNFNSAYWRTTIQELTKKGFRVIAPDQVGFGKSSKPVGYQYSFQQLSANTKALLDELKVEKIFLLGHSMGGMLATRFALMYPATVEKLILENPIGLEDWKVVTPYMTVDENYQKELRATFESAKKYQMVSYYDNQWKPAYDEWLYLSAGWTKAPDYPVVAMNNALTSDMIFTQPVVYEFSNITTPTLLIIGTRDRTAIGKDLIKDEGVRAKMGQYQLLGKATQQKIPGSRLAEIANVGHLPHIESFENFIEPLQRFLQQ
ncbi:MAG: alpha/beta hydrolase [Agriterribacter sp.]